MLLRQAEEFEYPVVKEFYDAVVDGMADSKYRPGWKKGKYPGNEYAYEAIMNGELYIGIEDGTVISAMVVNHRYNEEFVNVKWQKELTHDEFGVIHAFGVRPEYQKKGYGGQMVEYVVEQARLKGLKAIRLDVLVGNLPAEKLYPTHGFVLVEKHKMQHPNLGLVEFNMYERLL